MKKDELEVGGLYKWQHSSEQLIYLGNNWSGNGYWHQFAKVESPDVVWCENLDCDLYLMESVSNGSNN